MAINGPDKQQRYDFYYVGLNVRLLCILIKRFPIDATVMGRDWHIIMPIDFHHSAVSDIFSERMI